MKPLVTDALWERLEPLLPPAPQRRFHFPGRKPLDYRKILIGILFVLKTGIAWADLPAELAAVAARPAGSISTRCGTKPASGPSCTRCCSPNSTRLTRSTGDGPLIDASFAKAPEGGEDTGPNPTDCGKSGSKHHVLTDAQGIPLAATVTAANVNEVTQVFDVLTNMPPVGGKPGPPREKPERLQGDTG